MKAYQIEDTIIAYFDGRLNDSESAELMHRVSISPEIRDLFEQHQLLRRMAVRAARNVTVSPNVEDAVFANIAALSAKENKKPVAFWSMRRGAVAAGLALLLGAGAIATLQSSEPAAVSYVAHSGVTVTSDIARVHDLVPNSDHGNIIALADRVGSNIAGNQVPHPPVSTPLAASGSVGSEQHVDADLPISAVNDARTAQAEQIQPPTVISHSISDLLINSGSELSPFELGFANSSPATAMPNSARGIGPFQNWIATASYAVSPQDLAGIRVEQGEFFANRPTASQDATYYTSRLQQTSLTMFGAYYERRTFIGRGNFMLAADLGAGLYSGGNYVTLGIGGRLPITEHLLAGATASLTRKHDNLPGTNKPLLLEEGSSIHNTLITRIEYGLSYRF